MPLIIPATQTLAAGGYDIDNSCRFETSYMRRTNTAGSAGTNFTISFWFKRSALTTGSAAWTNPYTQYLYNGDTSYSPGNQDVAVLLRNDTLAIISGSPEFNVWTSAKFRDTSAWTHVVGEIDTTESTDTDRVKLYINGTRYPVADMTGASGSGGPQWPAEDATFDNTNDAFLQSVGGRETGVDTLLMGFSGYISEFHFVDGSSLEPDSFGETGDYGEWKPIEYTGSHGTTGFHLDFSTGANLGDDKSGNANDFTVKQGAAASDQMTDTPTNNFATLSVIDDSIVNKGTFSEGNLKYTGTSGGYYQCGQVGTMHTNQKIYYETLITKTPAGDWNLMGFAPDNFNPSQFSANNADTDLPGKNGNHGVTMKFDHPYYVYYDGSSTLSYQPGIADDDIISLAFDPATGKFWIAKNGVWAGTGGTGNPATGAYPLVTLTNLAHTWTAHQGCYNPTAEIVCNFGQDGTFAGNKTAGGNADDNGYGNFFYDVPAGFLALCSKNLTDCAVIPSEHFNTILYDDGAGAKTGVGFQPDLVWLKSRGSAYGHRLTDSERGVTKSLASDATAYETTDSTGLTAFGADGFTVGADTDYADTTGDGMVAWCWKGGSDASSTTTGTGTGKAYTASYNASAGFSIVSYLGNGSAGHTIPHHLGIKPQLIFVKRRPTGNDSWAVYNEPSGATKYMNLDAAGAAQTGIYHWNNTEPTSSVFTLYTNGGSNQNDIAYIAYLFGSIEGYSKIGSYEGNGNADGAFVYCGFRPAFIITKSVDSTSAWQIFDSKREGFNVDNDVLEADATSAETTTDYIDTLSNGFKSRIATDPNVAESYIYMAFAETPFKNANAR